jgi:hypothetical protein
MKCWLCNAETGLKETDFGDHNCQFCGVLISIYDPAKFEGWETQPKEEEVANLGDLRKNLRKEDVQAGDVIKFIDSGEIKDVDFSPAQDGSKVETVFQSTVELPSGKQKIYTPNATTRGILSDSWGEDTEAWVGKRAAVKFIDQLSFGKLTKVMVLEPME